jgi:hypothetical protein
VSRWPAKEALDFLVTPVVLEMQETPAMLAIQVSLELAGPVETLV